MLCLKDSSWKNNNTHVHVLYVLHWCEARKEFLFNLEGSMVSQSNKNKFLHFFSFFHFPLTVPGAVLTSGFVYIVLSLDLVSADPTVCLSVLLSSFSCAFLVSILCLMDHACICNKIIKEKFAKVLTDLRGFDLSPFFLLLHFLTFIPLLRSMKNF